MTAPDGTRQSWTRDIRGRVLSYTNAQGLTQTYSYDSAARLVALADSLGNPVPQLDGSFPKY